MCSPFTFFCFCSLYYKRSIVCFFPAVPVSEIFIPLPGILPAPFAPSFSEFVHIKASKPLLCIWIFWGEFQILMPGLHPRPTKEEKIKKLILSPPGDLIMQPGLRILRQWAPSLCSQSPQTNFQGREAKCIFSPYLPLCLTWSGMASEEKGVDLSRQKLGKSWVLSYPVCSPNPSLMTYLLRACSVRDSGLEDTRNF